MHRAFAGRFQVVVKPENIEPLGNNPGESESIGQPPMTPEESQPSYSQFGEDLILLELFPEASGCCLEVGAFNGIDGSNTLAFEKRGWKAILVEPLADLAANARRFRRGPVWEVAAGPSNGAAVLQRAKENAAYSGILSGKYQTEVWNRRDISLEPVEVAQRTVDAILEDSEVEHLDFATIDVEGFELGVLEGFDLRRWNPKIVLVEDNSLGLDRSVPAEMAAQGYSRFRTTGVNDWYARGDNRVLVTPSSRVRDQLRVRARDLRAFAKGVLPAKLRRAVQRFRARQRLMTR
jgi:FkbM family methyltransferase